MHALNFGDPRLPERFWSKATPCPMSGCWLWTACLSEQPNGYAKFFKYGAGATLGHRLAYVSLVGPIPDGLHIDHLCRTPCCVNPAHMEPVTSGENSRRGECGVKSGAQQRAKTHCPHGHEYTAANTGRQSKGGRYCRACRRDYQQRRKAMRR